MSEQLDLCNECPIRGDKRSLSNLSGEAKSRSCKGPESLAVDAVVTTSCLTGRPEVTTRTFDYCGREVTDVERDRAKYVHDFAEAALDPRPIAMDSDWP